VLDIYLKGFIVTISLIVAIGAQNAYVLKLGLLKQYVLLAVSLCILFDFILISAGVFGLGFFIQGNQFLINIIAIVGIVFLCMYAILSFKSAFKNESLQVLISTDVSARGIDVSNLGFIIHHQLPEQMEYYTHRSGRTARAGKKGYSIALVIPGEVQKIHEIQRELGIQFVEI